MLSLRPKPMRSPSIAMPQVTWGQVSRIRPLSSGNDVLYQAAAGRDGVGVHLPGARRSFSNRIKMHPPVAGTAMDYGQGPGGVNRGHKSNVATPGAVVAIGKDVARHGHLPGDLGEQRLFAVLTGVLDDHGGLDPAAGEVGEL